MSAWDAPRKPLRRSLQRLRSLEAREPALGSSITSGTSARRIEGRECAPRWAAAIRRHQLVRTAASTPLRSNQLSVDSASSMQQRKNAILGLYDRPLWSDWIAYLTLLGLIAGAMTVRGSEEAAARAIDLAFALAFQFVLFGVVPCVIRKAVRSRRSRSSVRL